MPDQLHIWSKVHPPSSFMKYISKKLIMQS